MSRKFWYKIFCGPGTRFSQNLAKLTIILYDLALNEANIEIFGQFGPP